MDIFIWILAFVGVALIYAAKPIGKIFTKTNPSEVVINILRAVGTVLCIGCIALLYMLGKLI